jgi:hypothetical protein
MHRALSAGVLLIGTLAGCGRPIRALDHLVVNTGNDYRAVVNATEEEGVQDIRRLLASTFSEYWAYSDGRWFEVGKDEVVHREGDKIVGMAVDYDAPYVDRLLHMNDHVTFYTLRPSRPEMVDARIGKELRTLTEEQLTGLRALVRSFDILPSVGELHNMIGVSRGFYRIHPEGEIAFKCCSFYGITEWGLSKRGKDHFFKIQPVDLWDAAKAAREALYGVITVAAYEDGRTYALHEADLLNNAYVNVNFKPYFFHIPLSDAKIITITLYGSKDRDEPKKSYPGKYHQPYACAGGKNGRH